MQVLVPLLLLHCIAFVYASASSTILISNPHLIEPLLENQHQERATHLVIGYVDDNPHPDAVVFYLTSTDSITCSSRSVSRVSYRYKILYDIALGTKDWHGRKGFYPIRNIGHSPSYTHSALRMTQTRTRRTLCSSDRDFSASHHQAVSFSLADLNNNGKPDIVMVGAVTGNHRDSGYTWQTCGENGCSCSWGRRQHMTIKVQILWDLEKDGSPSGGTSSSCGGDQYFQFSVGSTGTAVRPTANKVTARSPLCPSESPHLLEVFIASRRVVFCMNNNGNLNYQSRSTVSNLGTSSNVFSSSTTISLGDELYALFFGHSNYNNWRLIKGSSSFSVSGSAEDLSSTYTAVGVFDFDGDGNDDLLLLQCPLINRCEIRHGIVYLDDLEGNSAYDVTFDPNFL
ncbi:hypothetical protein P9112_008864 [Eukaryota sp. TZLM1-RC]